MELLADIPKIVRTIVVNLEFLALGVLQATPGPTLLDLQARVQTSSQEIALILVACLAGGLVGSMLDMFLNKKIHREILMIGYTFLIAVAHFVCPWWKHLTPLIVSMTFSGLFNGALNGGSNIYLLNLWGKRSRPFLQGLHSSFALGTFIAPLMTEPFLVEEEKLSEGVSNSTAVENVAEETPYLIYYPFGIGSAIMMASCVGFVALYCFRPAEFVKASKSENGGTIVRLDFVFKCVVVVLGMIQSALASALDLTTGTYITTFSVKCDLRLSKSTGSLITSAYWGSFTVGRLISVPLASKLSPLSMLLLNIVLCNVSGVILGGWGGNNEGALWAGSAIMGLGVSSMSPNVLLWMESLGCGSGIGTSLFVVSAFTGALILPLIIGFFIDDIPMIFMYALLSCTVISCVALVGCYVMSWLHGKREKIAPVAILPGKIQYDITEVLEPLELENVVKSNEAGVDSRSCT